MSQNRKKLSLARSLSIAGIIGLGASPVIAIAPAFADTAGVSAVSPSSSSSASASYGGDTVITMPTYGQYSATFNYDNLTVGTSYTLKTTVTGPDGKTAIDQGSSASVNFTPTEAKSSETVTLNIPDVKGQYKVLQSVVATNDQDRTLGLEGNALITVTPAEDNPSASASSTDSASPSASSTDSASSSASASSTDSASSDPSSSSTDSASASASSTDSASSEPSSSSTDTTTPEPSATTTETVTETPSASATATVTETPSSTPTATQTVTETPTPSATETTTSTPSATQTVTAISSPTGTPSVLITPIALPSKIPTVFSTSTATATGSPSTSVDTQTSYEDGATGGPTTVANADKVVPADTGISYYNESLAHTGSDMSPALGWAALSGILGGGALLGGSQLQKKQTKKEETASDAE